MPTSTTMSVTADATDGMLVNHPFREIRVADGASRVSIHVIPTDEELVLARHACDVLPARTAA